MSLDPLRRWEQRFGSLPLPSPPAWAALAAAFLGFGILLGHVTGADSSAALAASRRPLKLLVASSPPATTPSTPAPATPPPTAETPTPEGSSPETSSPASSPEPAPAKSAPPKSSDGGSPKPAGPKKTAPAGLAAVKHVFVIVLDDQSYAGLFGDGSPAHYLTGKLEPQGELLVRYYAVAHEALANEIALLSGQGPTEATAANCPTYTEISPAGSGADGQTLGQGCVYPSSTQTVISQLATKSLPWRAYIEGLGEGASGPPACSHPAAGAPDPSVSIAPGASAPAYETWRNPFVYFTSIAGAFSCQAHDMGIDELKGDLASEPRTASLSYIAPGPCDDGSPQACAPAKAAGASAADGWLAKYVPQILSSSAYKKDGLLVITSDQAPATGENADSSSCCAQPAYPNLPAPTSTGHGGGQVGALLLSPFLKKRGGFAQEPYNHYSLLATIEQIFGLPKLGYAGLSEVKPFSASLF